MKAASVIVRVTDGAERISFDAVVPYTVEVVGVYVSAMQAEAEVRRLGGRHYLEKGYRIHSAAVIGG